MMRRRNLLIFLLPVLAACPRAGAGKTAWTGATVITETGAPIPNAVVIVAEGRIDALGPAETVAIPRGAEVVDVSGRWIIPGLVDSHVHAERWTLPGYLAYGVTSARDMGGIQDSVIFLRDDIASGAVAGPRLFISGAMIDGVPAVWPGATAVRTPDDARRAVGNRVLIGASQVTVYTKITRRLLAPLLDEAKALEMPVAARLGMVDAVTAAQLGVHSIEQMSGVVQATVGDPAALYAAHRDFFQGWNAEERGWAQLDSAALDRVAHAIASAGTAIVPTLVLHEAWAHLGDQAFIDSVDVSAMPPGAVAAWAIPDLIRRAGLSRADFAAFRRSQAKQDLFVRLFLRAGGRIAAGTDSPNQLLPPGASLHRELRLLVAAGLTPAQALAAATVNGGRLIGSEDAGILRAGGPADFVVLRGDPLRDIANVGAVESVVAAGVVHHPADARVR